MAMNHWQPAENPYAGTMPGDDPGPHAARPSTGPGQRERDVIPASTTGNAMDDQMEQVPPRGKPYKPEE